MLHTDRPPNFICIGAQKCGTTWLYDNLRRHPDCSMPAEKEMRFFLPWKNKINEYSYKIAFGNKTSGDITPEYIMIPDNARLIHEKFPNAKLFVILRDPVDRAFSQYKMNKYALKTLGENVSFISCFRKNYLDMAKKGMYAEQLKPFLTVWEYKKNFEIFLFDDLLKNPVTFYNKICDYIDISHHTPTLTNERSRRTEEKIKPEDAKEVRNYYKNTAKKLNDLCGLQVEWDASR